MTLNVGTAGWSIPRAVADHFPADGTALQRYAARFPVAEINSSFHRPHRASTWERWRESVSEDFRFSVKVPKTITHQQKLVDCGQLLDTFLSEAGALGPKLAVLLVQLPPSLAYDDALVGTFFDELKARSSTPIACEPRHPSWFTTEADEHLARLQIARVAADPARCDGAGQPGGWRGISYWRLHGSPVMYRSSYADRIPGLASALIEDTAAREVWCIFDNTASSAAAIDALALIAALKEGPDG